MGDSFPGNCMAFWGPEQEAKKQASDKLSAYRWPGVCTGNLSCFLQIGSREGATSEQHQEAVEQCLQLHLGNKVQRVRP